MAELAERNPPSEDADDTSWVPRVDMEFKSDEAAYQFYNNYAKVVGFSVRKAWINRRASGVIISRTYVCYKEGYQGNRKDESEVKKPRQNERTGCLAHLTIKITANGTYRVSEFHPMHNHELVAPAKSHILKSHRVAKRARAVIANAASQKAMMECLVRQAGGYRQVAFVSVQDAADKSWAPKVDMEFENDEKAYQFYNDYAKRIGFDVRKAWVNRRSSGVIISRTYVCYKEGYYGNKKDENQVEKHRIRPNERTGCLARMVIKLAKNGRYRVTEFKPMHNHEFVTARTAHTLKSHRAANKIRNAEVNSVDDSCASPKVIHDHVSGQDVIHDHVSGQDASCPPRTVLSMQHKNYLPTKRKDALKPGDVGAMLEYMQERQVNDPSFYYAIQLDKEDRVTNVFWTDGKSVVDFYYFGDAICFDTTYKTNSCSRPFTLFYGVNHHKQTVIFGAALIYDETKESFMWLFETFKTAMYGKQPQVILTDQNPLIRNAINLVWPATTHRVCVWHMYQNASKYLGQVFQGSRTFAYDFSRCLFDCEEEEEFVSAWGNMLEKYDLKDNEWLKMLFEDRKKWAVAYGRETFCADMKSTQRLDSISGTLKENLSPERDLLQFLKHFERMLDEQWDAELQADCHATSSTTIIAPSRMLKQAASVYTPAMFEMFQREFEMSMDCMVHNSGAAETIYEYKVISEDNPKVHLVRFDSLNGTLVCSCKMFEFVGIQCRHVLKALDIINIKELPPQYYLKRWRKDAKVGSLRDNLGLATDIDPSSSKAMRLSSLCHIISIVAARAAETVEGYTFVQNQSDQLFDHVYQILQARPPEELQIS